MEKGLLVGKEDNPDESDGSYHSKVSEDKLNEPY